MHFSILFTDINLPDSKFACEYYVHLKLGAPGYGFQNGKTGTMSAKVVWWLGFLQNGGTNDE